jgi:dihydrofolate reductase
MPNVGKVIWHTMMSLDGYIAGPDDSMDWAFSQGGSSDLAERTRDQVGAVLAGRRWYDLASVRWNGVKGIYGGRMKGSVFVLTSHPQDAPDDDTVTFVSDGFEQALASAREAAGDRALGLFGSSIGTQAAAAGLLDELIVHVAPVLLGDGVRLYGDGAPQIQLERIELGQGEQVVDVRYRVVRK